MDKVTKWWATCTQCGHKIEPCEHRQVVEAESVLHKMKTGHRLLLQGEVTKEVRKCMPRCVAVGKLV